MAEHDLNGVAFPRLDEAQMAALGRCPLTTLKRYRDGEKLFEAGDRGLGPSLGARRLDWDVLYPAPDCPTRADGPQRPRRDGDL